jgi:uncharacterized hydrophobic protein (TIGR00271 family)
MFGGMSTRLLPDNQRRSVDELTQDLDLSQGDVRAKRSAFWTMLTLSAVIACAGVLSDSTATVIGAMIIAPLSTPILGVGLGIAKRDRGLSLRSSKYVTLGAALAIAVGVVFSLLVPGGVNLLANSQIAGRTSPGLTDLVAALATGVAGAVAMSRRDVAAVLPGVAIAISLVPPLAVVGVCLGQGAFGLAFGALLLFLSNLLALVLIGALVFTVIAQRGSMSGLPGASRRKTYLALSILMLLILVPLLVNTATTILVAIWTARVTSTAQSWAAQEPGTLIEDVEVKGTTVVVHVLSPGKVPDPADLVSRLDGQVPQGVTIVVDASLGQEIEAGVVGGG